jgi:hypothetical protein
LNDDAQENVVIAEKPVIGNDGDIEEKNNDDDNNNDVGNGNLSTVDGDMEDNINDSSLSPTYDPTDEPSPKPSSSPVTAQPSPSPTDEPTMEAEEEEEEEEIDNEDNSVNPLVDDYPLIDDTNHPLQLCMRDWIICVLQGILLLVLQMRNDVSVGLLVVDDCLLVLSHVECIP